MIRAGVVLIIIALLVLVVIWVGDCVERGDPRMQKTSTSVVATLTAEAAAATYGADQFHQQLTAQAP